jgi:hypothetical protein
LPSLFETRRRLPISATYHRCAGNLTRTLDPRRDGDLDLLPFLNVTRPLSFDQEWHAASRATPVRSTPVLVSPTSVGLPSRDAEKAAPPPKLAPRCIVRIDVHESKDQAKDASSNEMQRFLHPSSAYALWRMPTTFPSLAPFGHPLSSARWPCGGIPAQLTDRPRSSFRQRPAKSAAFQKTGMPFTATTREGVFVAERLLPPAFAPALSLTPPTLCSQGWGQCFDRALQGTAAVTRLIRASREYRRLWDSLELRAWS